MTSLTPLANMKVVSTCRLMVQLTPPLLVSARYANAGGFRPSSMDTTTGLRLANTSPDVAAFSERNAATSGDPAGPAISLGTPLNNVEHFRYHRSSDEKLSLEKREAALVQIMGVRPPWR